MTTIKEKVYRLLMSMPDTLLSYRDIANALDLEYRQVTRAMQSLKKEDIIYKYTDKSSGLGRGRGKIAYFGIKEKHYADSKKIRN